MRVAFASWLQSTRQARTDTAYYRPFAGVEAHRGARAAAVIMAATGAMVAAEVLIPAASTAGSAGASAANRRSESAAALASSAALWNVAQVAAGSWERSRGCAGFAQCAVAAPPGCTCTAVNIAQLQLRCTTLNHTQ